MQLFADETENSDRCAYETLHGASIGVKHPLLFGRSSSWEQDPADACNTSKNMYLKVDKADEKIAGHPLEIAVYEEPPLKDKTGRELSAAPEEPEWTTLKAQSTNEDTVPGTSIARAPIVENGTYAMDINPGESQVLAVPVGWGQNLQAQLDAPLTDKIKRAGGVGSGVEVHIISPVRGNNEVSLYGKEPKDWTTTAFGNLFIQPDKTFRTGAQSHTISFRNRGSSNSSVKAADLPGIHYVQVTYNVMDDVNMPYTLTLQTNDASADAAPIYAKTTNLLVPRADSKLVTEMPSKAAKNTKKKLDHSKPDENGFPIWVVGFGLAGIIAVAAGAIFWRIRRTR